MSNLTFIIDNQTVETSESTEFTRVYRGADNLDTKKNNYSLTVKFPFTYNNEKIFLRTNSLSYRSAFPYQTHVCNVLKDGVTLISNGKLVLLSTTNGFECSITWDDVDIIGNLINNNTSLGYLLHNFPLLNWDFNDNLFDWDYSTGKANTYGIFKYYSGGSHYFDVTVPGVINQVYTLPHPLVNFYYLLNEVFTALGYSFTIPTAKENFLKSLLIRPNKRINSYKNTNFKCCFSFFETSDLGQVIYLVPNFKNINYLDSDKNLGNNSFYFRVETTDVNGTDYFTSLPANINVYDPVTDYYVYSKPRQSYRVQCMQDCIGTLTIDNFGTGETFTTCYRFDSFNKIYVELFTFNAPYLYTFDLKKDDFLVFVNVDHDSTLYFELSLDVAENPSHRGVETKMAFPSLFHIPSCIGLTVGEFINEALILTGSELDYDINSNSFVFIDKIKRNKSSYDITKNIVNFKEIKYDTKYLYNNGLGQNNYFKYASTSPINADYNKTVANTSLILDKTQVQSKFFTSENQTVGTYTGLLKVTENNDTNIYSDYFEDFYYNIFTEKNLNLLYNDVANSKVIYVDSILKWETIFNNFYADWLSDLESLVLSGSIRLIKLNANIGEVEFKRINTKGNVYISTTGKYYSIVEITKQGDECELFLLELF